MNDLEFASNVRDVNLSYLMLAQQMINHDKATAMYKLGIDAENAALIGSLSNAQIIKLSSNPNMLLKFRFENSVQLSSIVNQEASDFIGSSKLMISVATNPLGKHD